MNPAWDTRRNAVKATFTASNAVKVAFTARGGQGAQEEAA
jgi:hypothetical protein